MYRRRRLRQEDQTSLPTTWTNCASTLTASTPAASFSIHSINTAGLNSAQPTGATRGPSAETTEPRKLTGLSWLANWNAAWR